jgi:uncharacterized membrane protein
MSSLPLHPAVVHVPLGLAFVMPFLAAGFAWALWSGRVRVRAWVVILGLQAALFGAGLVAMNTGEREEDRVERVVPHAALERHEEYAEQFVWATGLTLMTAALVLVARRRAVAHALALATVAGSVVVGAAAIRVGHAGGELVYVHQAGAAYAAQPRAAADTTDAAAYRRRSTEGHGR